MVQYGLPGIWKHIIPDQIVVSLDKELGFPSYSITAGSSSVNLVKN